MDSDEKILAHVLSVWREPKKLFAAHGKEGMLILTDRHLAFVHKTEAKMKWWQAARQRQTINFLRDENIMLTQDGYGERNLMNDLENEKNLELSFDDILDIHDEEKAWGTVLVLEFSKNGKKEKYQFSVVQDWVKYPFKDPTKYMKIDWSPLVQYVKDKQKITK